MKSDFLLSRLDSAINAAQHGCKVIIPTSWLGDDLPSFINRATDAGVNHAIGRNGTELRLLGRPPTPTEPTDVDESLADEIDDGLPIALPAATATPYAASDPSISLVDAIKAELLDGLPVPIKRKRGRPRKS